MPTEWRGVNADRATREVFVDTHAADGLDLDEVDLLGQAWAEVQPQVARRLLIAAVQAFAARGYHATTTRDIAGQVGLSPAGVYVHFRSKEELLYRISLLGHQQSLRVISGAAAAHDDPVDRLRAVVRDFTAWHARYHTPARVIQYELHALSAEHYAEITSLRRDIDHVVRESLDHGIARGVFDVPDVPGAALALLSLSVDVARWYRSSGRRLPEDVGALYADLALRMVTRPG
jgi:AcrR family transcriptional regulator